MTKRIYLSPTVEVTEVTIENGIATTTTNPGDFGHGGSLN